MFINKENLIGIFVFGFIMLTNCSDNNEKRPDNAVIASILDKWWYPDYSGTDEIYIHSNGRYEQKHPNSEVTNYTGHWILEDEQVAIIKVDYDEGTDQNISTIWLLFAEIREHSFEVYQSSDGKDFSVPSAIYHDANN